MVKNEYVKRGMSVIIYVKYKGEQKEVLVDLLSFKKLQKSETEYKFFLMRDTSVKIREKFYVVHNEKTQEGKTKSILMHRLIMDNPKGMVVDHKDGNPLNNRRGNLRTVTQAQNAQNRYGAEIRSNTGIRGVSYCNRYQKKKWRAKVKAQGKVVFDKYFATIDEAEEAVIEARKQYHN